MGGATLPTASTPGYDYFTDKNTGREHVACYHLIQFLTAAEKLGLARGMIKVGLDIVQLVGGAEASGNTHLCGSAFDVKQVSDPWLRIFREMGAAFWPRLDDPKSSTDLWDDNEHGHGVITCAHDACNEYQMTAYWRGYSGLGRATSGPYAGLWGYGSKDPNPWRPSVRRTVAEGLTWAAAQTTALNASTTQSLEEKIMALPAEERRALIEDIGDEVWRRKAGGNPATLDLHVLNANIKAGNNGHALKRIEAILGGDAFTAKVVQGVVAQVNASTGSLTTEQLQAATEAGVRAALGSLDNQEA